MTSAPSDGGYQRALAASLVIDEWVKESLEDDDPMLRYSSQSLTLSSQLTPSSISKRGPSHLNESQSPDSFTSPIDRHRLSIAVKLKRGLSALQRHATHKHSDEEKQQIALGYWFVSRVSTVLNEWKNLTNKVYLNQSIGTTPSEKHKYYHNALAYVRRKCLLKAWCAWRNDLSQKLLAENLQLRQRISDLEERDGRLHESDDLHMATMEKERLENDVINASIADLHSQITELQDTNSKLHHSLKTQDLQLKEGNDATMKLQHALVEAEISASSAEKQLRLLRTNIDNIIHEKLSTELRALDILKAEIERVQESASKSELAAIQVGDKATILAHTAQSAIQHVQQLQTDVDTVNNQTKYQALEVAYETLEQKYVKVTEELTEAQSDLRRAMVGDLSLVKDFSRQLQRAVDEKEKMTEKIKNVDNIIKDLETTEEQKRKSLESSYESQLSTLSQQLSAVTTLNTELQSMVSLLQTQLQIVNEDVSQSHAALSNAQSQLTTLKTSYDEEIKQLKIENEILNAGLKTARDTTETFKTEIQMLNNDYQVEKKQKMGIQEALKQQAEQMKTVEIANEILKQKLDELKLQYNIDEESEGDGREAREQEEIISAAQRVLKQALEEELQQQHPSSSIDTDVYDPLSLSSLQKQNKTLKYQLQDAQMRLGLDTTKLQRLLSASLRQTEEIKLKNTMLHDEMITERVKMNEEIITLTTQNNGLISEVKNFRERESQTSKVQKIKSPPPSPVKEPPAVVPPVEDPPIVSPPIVSPPLTSALLAVMQGLPLGSSTPVADIEIELMSLKNEEISAYYRVQSVICEMDALRLRLNEELKMLNNLINLSELESNSKYKEMYEELEKYVQQSTETYHNSLDALNKKYTFACQNEALEAARGAMLSSKLQVLENDYATLQSQYDSIQEAYHALDQEHSQNKETLKSIYNDNTSLQQQLSDATNEYLMKEMDFNGVINDLKLENSELTHALEAMKEKGDEERHRHAYDKQCSNDRITALTEEMEALKLSLEKVSQTAHDDHQAAVRAMSEAASNHSKTLRELKQQHQQQLDGVRAQYDSKALDLQAEHRLQSNAANSQIQQLSELLQKLQNHHNVTKTILKRKIYNLLENHKQDINNFKNNITELETAMAVMKASHDEDMKQKESQILQIEQDMVQLIASSEEDVKKLTEALTESTDDLKITREALQRSLTENDLLTAEVLKIKQDIDDKIEQEIVSQALISSLNNSLSEKDKHLKSLEDELHSLTDKYNTVSHDLETLRPLHDEVVVALQCADTEINQNKCQLSNLSNEIISLKSQVAELQATIHCNNLEISSLLLQDTQKDGQLKESQSRLETATDIINSKINELNLAHQQLNSLQSKFDDTVASYTAASSELIELYDELYNVKNEATDLTNELNHLKSNYEVLNKEHDTALTDLHTAQRERDDVTSHRDHLQKQLAAADDYINNLETELTKYQGLCEEREGQLEKINSLNLQLNKKINEKQEDKEAAIYALESIEKKILLNQSEERNIKNKINNLLILLDSLGLCISSFDITRQAIDHLHNNIDYTSMLFNHSSSTPSSIKERVINDVDDDDTRSSFNILNPTEKRLKRLEVSLSSSQHLSLEAYVMTMNGLGYNIHKNYFNGNLLNIKGVGGGVENYSSSMISSTSSSIHHPSSIDHPSQAPITTPIALSLLSSSLSMDQDSIYDLLTLPMETLDKKIINMNIMCSHNHATVEEIAGELSVLREVRDREVKRGVELEAQMAMMVVKVEEAVRLTDDAEKRVQDTPAPASSIIHHPSSTPSSRDGRRAAKLEPLLKTLETAQDNESRLKQQTQALIQQLNNQKGILAEVDAKYDILNNKYINYKGSSIVMNSVLKKLIDIKETRVKLLIAERDEKEGGRDEKEGGRDEGGETSPVPVLKERQSPVEELPSVPDTSTELPDSPVKTLEPLPRSPSPQPPVIESPSPVKSQLLPHSSPIALPSPPPPTPPSHPHTSRESLQLAYKTLDDVTARLVELEALVRRRRTVLTVVDPVTASTLAAKVQAELTLLENEGRLLQELALMYQQQ